MRVDTGKKWQSYSKAPFHAYTFFFYPALAATYQRKHVHLLRLAYVTFLVVPSSIHFITKKKKINCLIVALQYLLVTCIPHVLHSVISGGYPELFHFLAILNWNPRNRNLSCADFISFEWFPKNEWSGCHLLPYAMHLFSGFWRISYFLP